MTRITNKEIKATFAFFCKVNNKSMGHWLPREDNAPFVGNVGGLALDYAPSYGGWVIVQIVNTGGGQSTPFGTKRRTGKAFHEFLHSIIDYKFWLDQ